jgi:hypothetical protein
LADGPVFALSLKATEFEMLFARLRQMPDVEARMRAIAKQH